MSNERENRRKERGYAAKIEAIGRFFEEKGWDERVPGLIRKWGRKEGFYRLQIGVHPGFPDIDLQLQNIDISTRGSWDEIGFCHFDRSLAFTAAPIEEVRAIQKGDERFDGEDKIEVVLPRHDLKVVISQSEGARVFSTVSGLT